MRGKLEFENFMDGAKFTIKIPILKEANWVVIEIFLKMLKK
jgi:hypothetical protein